MNHHHRRPTAGARTITLRGNLVSSFWNQPWRRWAAGSTAGLVVAGLASTVALPSAQAAELSKSLDYACQVTAGSLNLRENIVGVKAQTTVPDSVRPGEVIPPTQVRITLTLPEKLRSASVDQLYGVKARGASTNSYVSLTSGGQTENVAIPSLSAADTPIPQTAGALWTIPASGNTPAITTPASASGSVTLGMPAAFFINATITDDLNEEIPSTLDCKAPAGANLTMGSIAIGSGTPTTPTDGPTSEPTDGPTSEPTDGPTSEPTDEPTSEPTTEPTPTQPKPTTPQPTEEPTEEPTDDPGLSGIRIPDEVSPGGAMVVRFPSGWVGQEVEAIMHSDPVSLGSKTVGSDSKVRVQIPKNAEPGAHTLYIEQYGETIASADFRVVAADVSASTADETASTTSTTSSYLANTGGPSWWVAGLGVLALLGGIGMLLGRRVARD